MIRPDFEVDGIIYSHENVAHLDGFRVYKRDLFELIPDDTREESHRLGECYFCDDMPRPRPRDTSESVFSWM